MILGTGSSDVTIFRFLHVCAGGMVVPPPSVRVPVLLHTADKMVVNTCSSREARATDDAKEVSLVPIGLLWFRLGWYHDSAVLGFAHCSLSSVTDFDGLARVTARALRSKSAMAE